jgi:hypothetical protein
MLTPSSAVLDDDVRRRRQASVRKRQRPVMFVPATTGSGASVFVSERSATDGADRDRRVALDVATLLMS